MFQYAEGALKSSMQDFANRPVGEPAQTVPSLERVRQLAIECGFSDAGVVALPHAEERRDAARYREWIEAGRAATMQYLERRSEEGELLRARVAVPFPWARSVLVCFASYHSHPPRSIDASPDGAAWIARYAWSQTTNDAGQKRPSDYHKVLLKRLHALEAKLRSEHGDFTARAYVDTGPLVERSLAAAAGIGWVGKNTCVIHPRLGSFGFLAVLVTDLAVEESNGHLTVPDRCGHCRRCLDACPTAALTEPYQMDAARCIAYLTIEHRGPISAELMEGMGRQIFGCDICQDVCPWNRKAPVAVDGDLEPRAELVNPALQQLAAMDEAAFEAAFNGSPVRRARFDGFRRNVAVAIGNSGAMELGGALRAWEDAADAGLRAAARWALTRLGVRRREDEAEQSAR